MLAFGTIWWFRVPLKTYLIYGLTLAFVFLMIVGIFLYVTMRLSDCFGDSKNYNKCGVQFIVVLLNYPQASWDYYKRVVTMRHPKCHRFMKWVAPMSATAAAQFLMMVLLHAATYYYILYMVRFEAEQNKDADKKGLPYPWISPGKLPTDVSYGSVLDVPESFLPVIFVNMKVLDAVAALLPMCFVVGCWFSGHLDLWTKVFMCHALLALTKGVIDLMTVMPDSNGWQVCQARLGADGIASFRTAPDPSKVGALSNLFYFFMKEVGDIEKGHVIRFCSDMMVSGHTFVTCLYALGLCELVSRYRVREGINVFWYRACLLLVVTEQLIEITLVLLSHFHYSADIAMAIMITLLWYTNGPLLIYAKWWSSDFGSFHVGKKEGDIWVPPCCVPFCEPKGDCCTGNARVHSIMRRNDVDLKADYERNKLYAKWVTFDHREGVIIDVQMHTKMGQVIHDAEAKDGILNVRILIPPNELEWTHKFADHWMPQSELTAEDLPDIPESQRQQLLKALTFGDDCGIHAVMHWDEAKELEIWCKEHEPPAQPPQMDMRVSTSLSTPTSKGVVGLMRTSWADRLST